MDTKKLKQKILDLAIRGKLVPQNPNDEPASVLLDRIRAEKERLIAEGKIKRPKKSKTPASKSQYQNFEPPFEIPESWEWVKMGLIGEVITGNTPSKDRSELYGGSIPFFKPSDLEQGINTLSASDSLSELGYDCSRKLPAYTILVTCIGATIGKTGLIRTFGSCNQQINAVIPNLCIIPEFLYYVCISDYFQSEIKKRASATTLPILNKSGFSAINIPLPPINEQKNIVDLLHKTFSFISAMELSSDSLHIRLIQTKSKILDLAMQGKLVPQDPADEPAADMLRRVNPKAEIITDNPHSWNIPNGWCVTTIGSIATSYIGLTYRPEDINSMGVPVLRSNNIQNGELDYSDLVRVNCKIADKLFLQNGDLLICARNGSRNLIGKNTLINKLTESTTFGAFMAVCRSEWNRWIQYILNSLYFNNYLDNSNSTAINQITQKMLLNCPILLPPTKEQYKIIERIEELYNILDEIEASLQA